MPLAFDGLLAFAFFGFWIYCLIDAIASPRGDVRTIPKLLWVLVILVLADLGALAWVVLGRPRNQGWMPGGLGAEQQPRSVAPRSRRPMGPEDSPEFEDRLRRARERQQRDRRFDQDRPDDR
jgi:hypothetical protein